MSDLVLRSHALDVARARVDVAGPDGTPMRNPLLSAMEAERASVDRLATADASVRALAAERAQRGDLGGAGSLGVEARLISGVREVALLPGVVDSAPQYFAHRTTRALARRDTPPEERARISTGVGVMSSVARAGAVAPLFDLVAEAVLARTGVRVEARGAGAGPASPWRTWSIRLWSADAASGQFGYLRAASAVLGAKVAADLEGHPREEPAWLEVRDVEDLGGREFGWAARVGAARAPVALLGEEGPVSVSVVTDPPPVRAPDALPAYHTILVEGGQQVRVSCPGAPPLCHPGGSAQTVGSVVAFDDEIDRLCRFLRDVGCRVVVDPSESEGVEFEGIDSEGIDFEIA